MLAGFVCFYPFKFCLNPFTRQSGLSSPPPWQHSAPRHPTSLILVIECGSPRQHPMCLRIIHETLRMFFMTHGHPLFCASSSDVSSPRHPDATLVDLIITPSSSFSSSSSASPSPPPLPPLPLRLTFYPDDAETKPMPLCFVVVCAVVPQSLSSPLCRRCR